MYAVDEAQRARWLIAPFVSRAARELARERGCHPDDLSAATMETLRDLALLCLSEGQLNRQPPVGAFQAPPPAAADPWAETTSPARPSRMPTRRAPQR